MSEAVNKALKMLERRDYSEGELISKLTEKGIAQTEAEEAVGRMVSLGFVNDERYAELVVRHSLKKGYGPRRIRDELYRHMVPKELWDAAMAELPEQSDTVEMLVERKLRGKTPDKKELKKVTDMLLRRGFGWNEINAVLRKYDFSEGFDE